MNPDFTFVRLAAADRQRELLAESARASRITEARAARAAAANSTQQSAPRWRAALALLPIQRLRNETAGC